MALDVRRFSDSSKTPKSQNSPTTYKSPKSQTSPTFQQILQGEAPSSPFGKQHDFEGVHSPLRRSVLSKVKEKAKKLRHTLSNKRRHGQDVESSSCNFTPSWGVSLEDEEDDEDPEYLGAPMYESELAPEMYKQAARQHPREVHVPSVKYVLESSVKNDSKKDEVVSPNKTIAETVSEKLAPAYAAMSDATHTIASRIAHLTVETPTPPDNPHPATSTLVSPIAVENENANGERSMESRAHTSPHTWDKGVSVKEYLMKKLEPGEDEKALSQVISEAISPKTSPRDQMGMVEKVKGAVTSLLWTEDNSSNATTTTTTTTTSTTPKTNSDSVSPRSTNANASSQIASSNAKATSLPRDLVYNGNAKTSTQSPLSPTGKNNSALRNPRIPNKAKSFSYANPPSAITNTSSSKLGPNKTMDRKLSSYIPISTSAHEVTKEESRGRVLQAN